MSMLHALLVAACLLLPAALAGQTPSPHPLTLAEARERARTLTHPVQEQEAAMAQAAARHRAAAAARRPQVALEARSARLNDVPPATIGAPGLGEVEIAASVPHQHRTAAALRAPLFTGYRLRHQEEAAASALEASQGELAARRQEQAAAAERAYWDLHRARAAARTVAESVHLVAEHLADVERLQQAGVAPHEEVLEAQVRLTETQLRLVQAEHGAELAQAVLARLVALPLDTPLALADSLQPVAAALPALPELQEQAALQRPEVRALRLHAQAARQQHRAARGDAYPQVALTAEYALENPSPRYFPPADEWHDTWRVGVGATWTAWDWGLAQQQVEQARAQVRRVHEQLQTLSEAVALEVLHSRLRVAESSRRLELAGRMLAQAAERLRNLRQRYAAGAATTTEVLDAQVAQERARLAEVEALADQRIAWSELERAAGGALR
ncbi:MAG: TolC family protein [Candidatus Latescibacterota bacterium]